MYSFVLKFKPEGATADDDEDEGCDSDDNFDGYYGGDDDDDGETPNEQWLKDDARLVHFV